MTIEQDVYRIVGAPNNAIKHPRTEILVLLMMAQRLSFDIR
jgi:hypothetical protein